MTAEYGRLKEEAQELDEWRRRTLETAYEVKKPEEEEEKMKAVNYH